MNVLSLTTVRLAQVYDTLTLRVYEVILQSVFVPVFCLVGLCIHDDLMVSLCRLGRASHEIEMRQL